MNGILVSVIMPVYNTKEEYLREAVESILNQSYSEFEFIIVDDASDETTKKCINSFNDERIVVLSNNENLGVTKSLNRGLRISKGKYIARMDSDDVSMLDRIEKQVIYMEDHPDTDILGSFVQDGDKIRQEFLDITQLERKTLFLLENVGPIHPSVMIRKSFLGSYDLEYDEKFVVAQDYDLWVRCNEFTNIRFYPEVLLIRRKHPGQIGKKRNTLQHEMAAKIKTQRLLPVLDGVYTEEKTFRILLSITDGGATYSELCKFLRTIKRCLAENPLYDPKATDYIVSAYKIRYLRNNYSYVKKRIFQFGLLLSGEYIVYFRYLQNKLKIREMNE